MALARHKIRVVYGKSEVIELTGQDWLKVLSRTFLFSEATGDRPEGFVPQEAEIAFDNTPEVGIRSGLELRPEGGFNQVTIFNPNEGLPLEIELLIGTGDVRDSSVSFNIDPSAALAVNVEKFATEATLPVSISGRVQIDNEYQYYNPVGVVVRGGAGFDSTTPMHVVLPEGDGTGMAVSGEVLITNPADNPVCVSICDITQSISGVLNVYDNLNYSQARSTTTNTQNTADRLTATNAKLDITNNGLGSVASGVASTNALLGGIDTDLGAIRLDQANTANSTATIAVNSARGTMENPIHTTAVFDGDLVTAESTHTNPTFTRRTRITENFGWIDVAGRLSYLGGNSFLTEQSFAPQQITIPRSTSSPEFWNPITIDDALPIFDFNFRSQVKLFDTNFNRKKVVLKPQGTAVLLSHEPFALPYTVFSDERQYLATIFCLFASWFADADAPTPELMIRNVADNVISGSGLGVITGHPASTRCPALSSGGLVNGVAPFVYDGQDGSSPVALRGNSNLYGNVPFANRQGNGVYNKSSGVKFLRPGETYETESHRPIYVLAADNRTTFESAELAGALLEFEELNYDTE